MSDIQLKWFVRRVVVPVLSWAIGRVPDLEALGDAFDLSYKHRTVEWRRHVWSLAAERNERKAAR